MRRNSGDDEGRNRHLDPTMKEHERQRGKSGSAVLDSKSKKGETVGDSAQRTTGMGSSTRKSDGKSPSD